MKAYIDNFWPGSFFLFYDGQFLIETLRKHKKSKDLGFISFSLHYVLKKTGGKRKTFEMGKAQINLMCSSGTSQL